MRRENRKDDAVSPVIGVMLMLVVTVVIAAVVVGFSTGLAGSSSTTPTAMFEVSSMDTGVAGLYGEELIYLNIRHKGGDAIPLSDLKINLEQVGGFNSGMIRTYTASDEKSHRDYAYAGMVEAPPGEPERYAAAKAALKTNQQSFNTALTNAGKDVAEYSESWKSLSYPAGRGALMRYLSGLGLDSSDTALSDTVKNLVYNNQVMTEIETALGGKENLIFDKETGNLLGGMNGIKETYPITVLGQDIPTKSTVSTGNIIHISPVTGHVGDVIPAGCSVKWTISYIPTNSIIAKGEFEVIAD